MSAAAGLMWLLAFLAPESVPLNTLLASEQAAPAGTRLGGQDRPATAGSGRGPGLDHRARPLLPTQPGRERFGAGAPPGADHHPSPAHPRGSRPMAAGRRSSSRGGRAHRPRSVHGMAGMCGSHCADY